MPKYTNSRSCSISSKVCYIMHDWSFLDWRKVCQFLSFQNRSERNIFFSKNEHVYFDFLSVIIVSQFFYWYANLWKMRATASFSSWAAMGNLIITGWQWWWVSRKWSCPTPPNIKCLMSVFRVISKFLYCRN